MRVLVWLLALTAVAVAIALAAAGNGGYVLLVLPPWRIELSLNLLLFLLLLGFALAHGVLRLLAVLRSLPQRARRYRAGRARQEGEQALHQALRLFYEGRYGHALKQAAVAADNDHAPALAALVAARAAHAMQERDKTAEWLARAEQAHGHEGDGTAAEHPDRLAVLMTSAELAVDARRYEDALAALAQVHQRRGRHIAALRLELRARQGLGQWDEVLRLVRLLEKRDALPNEVATELRTRAHRENLRQRRRDPQALLAYRATLSPADLSPRLAAALVDDLLAAGLLREAESVLLDQLALACQPELLRRLGTLPPLPDAAGSPDKTSLRRRLAVAEQWLPLWPQDPDLLLTLGRLCLALQLWGKAQSYLEAVLSQRNDRAAHLELARLAETLGRPEDAERHYRDSARMS